LDLSSSNFLSSSIFLIIAPRTTAAGLTSGNSFLNLASNSSGTDTVILGILIVDDTENKIFCFFNSYEIEDIGIYFSKSNYFDIYKGCGCEGLINLEGDLEDEREVGQASEGNPDVESLSDTSKLAEKPSEAGFESEGVGGRMDVSNFALQPIADVYSSFKDGEEVWFMGENGERVRVLGIEKVGYEGRMYDVDVENDVILVERTSEVCEKIQDEGFESGRSLTTPTTPPDYIISNLQNERDVSQAEDESHNSLSLSDTFRLAEKPDKVGFESEGGGDEITSGSEQSREFNEKYGEGEWWIEGNQVCRNQSLVVWSGNSNNGTANGDAGPNMSGGRIRGGFEFDGEGDGINLGETGLNVTNITVSTWVKLSDTQNSRIFAAKYADTRGWGLGINDSANNIVKWFTSTDGGSTNTLDSSTTLSNNVWYHVVGTFNGTTKELYVNGVLDNNISWANTIGYTSSVSGIGYLRSNNVQYFNGTIDEVLIFNRSLSASEISELYQAGAGRFTDLTNASGYIDRQELIEYENIGGTKYYYSNYSIDAVKSGYDILVNSWNVTSEENEMENNFEISTDNPHNIICDSGDLSGTCVINTAHAVVDGDNINGTGSIVIESGGSLWNASGISVVINMTGNVTVESGIRKLSKKIDEYSEDRQGSIDVGVGILVDSDFNGFLKNLKAGLSDRVRTKEKEIDEVLKSDLIDRESKFKEKYEGLVREYNLKKKRLEGDMARKYALKVKSSLRNEVSLEFDKKLEEKFNLEKKRLDKEYKEQLKMHADEVLDKDEVRLRKKLESEFLKRSKVLDVNFRKEQVKIMVAAENVKKKLESERKRELNKLGSQREVLSSQKRNLADTMAKFEVQKKEERKRLHEKMARDFHEKLDSEIVKREKVIRAKLTNEFELKLRKGIQEHEERLNKKKMDLELEIQNKMKSLLN